MGNLTSCYCSETLVPVNPPCPLLTDDVNGMLRRAGETL